MGATMTDVYIVVFSIIGLLISYPGLAVVLNLLMPRVIEHAYRRLTLSPVITFIVGLGISGFFALWVVVLSAVNAGVVKGFAGLMLLGGLGLHAVGSAALSRVLGERIGVLTGSGNGWKDLVRGAVVYELACLTPLVGWFLFLPLMTASIMGAGAFGLLRWSPREKQAAAAPPNVSDFEEDIQSVWATNS